jgi:hypothetical protein
MHVHVHLHMHVHVHLHMHMHMRMHVHMHMRMHTHMHIHRCAPLFLGLSSTRCSISTYVYPRLQPRAPRLQPHAPSPKHPAGTLGFGLG